MPLTQILRGIPQPVYVTCPSVTAHQILSSAQKRDHGSTTARGTVVSKEANEQIISQYFSKTDKRYGGRKLLATFRRFGGKVVNDSIDDRPRCPTVAGDRCKLLKGVAVELDLLRLPQVQFC